MYEFTEQQLMTYLSCPLRFKFEQIDGRGEGPCSPARAFGQAIHEALFAFHRAQMQGTPMEVEDLLERFHALWEEAQGALIYTNGETAQSLSEKGEALLSRYAEEPPQADVLAVHEPYRFDPVDPDTGEVSGVTLTGHIDLIESNGTVAAVDFKTSARRLTDDQIDNNLRLTLYATALEQQGITAPELRIDLLLKTREPQIVRYTAHRSPEAQGKLFRTVQAVVKALDARIFYPRHGYQCAGCPHTCVCAEW